MKPYSEYKCPWCFEGPIQAIGEPEYSDNRGEGGNGVGRWYQVFEHQGCKKPNSNGFTRWTYTVKRDDESGKEPLSHNGTTGKKE